MPVYRKGVMSQFGRFTVEASEAGITRVLFPENSARFPDTADSILFLEDAVSNLDLYFSGKPYDFSKLEYDFFEQTEFEEKILRALLHKKCGLLSYAKLAELAGAPRSSRAVGNAMNKNPFPILIPCHHVIRSDGTLGQYAFGTAWKKRLLEHEKLRLRVSESATERSAILL